MEIVKILHCGEGGDAEQIARTSKQISRVYICISQLNSTLTWLLLLIIIYLVLFICLHLFWAKKAT